MTHLGVQESPKHPYFHSFWVSTLIIDSKEKGACFAQELGPQTCKKGVPFKLLTCWIKKTGVFPPDPKTESNDLIVPTLKSIFPNSNSPSFNFFSLLEWNFYKILPISSPARLGSKTLKLPGNVRQLRDFWSCHSTRYLW